MSAAQNGGKALDDEKPNDEHLYDNMNSPTFEDVPKDGEEKGDNQLSEAERQRQIEEWKEELTRVEGEITTLRQVLGSKVRYASELKRKIGITPFQELKQDVQSGIKSIKESDTYQKTNEKLTNVKDRITGSSAYVKTNEKIHEINDKITHSSAYQKTSSTLKTAGEKTSTAVSSIGASMSKKMGEIRNSQTFKSMEERVGDVYANVKTSRSIENIRGRFGLAKVTGSKSEGNFEEALESDSPKTEQPETLPEEKVPL